MNTFNIRMIPRTQKAYREWREADRDDPGDYVSRERFGLWAFAAGAAHEREVCQAIADCGGDIAEAIRARGQE